MKTSITYRDIIKLGLPIYGGLFASTIVGIADTAFLGEVNLQQQAAAGYGSLFYLVFFVIGMGFTLSTQIIIARRIGEQKYEQVGSVFWNSVFFMLFYSTLIFICFHLLADRFFDQITQSKEIGSLTAVYIRERAFGVFGTMLNLSFMALYVGKGKSLAITLSSVSAALINIILDYGLIFGHWGLAPMGIRGAAIASGIAELAGTLVFVIYTLFQKDMVRLAFYSAARFNAATLRMILNIAVPLMLQNMISILSWFLFFTMIEKTGERNFGISIIIRQIYSVFMMGPISLGFATNSMVSNLIGRQRKEEVLNLVGKAARFSLVFMLISALPLMLAPFRIFMFFTTDTQLAHDAMHSLISLILALFIFCISTVIFQSVSGTGKTRVALMIEISAIFLYLLYTFFSVNRFPHQLYIIWMAEGVYMLFMGVFAYIYMRSGRWKSGNI